MRLRILVGMFLVGVPVMAQQVKLTAAPISSAPNDKMSLVELLLNQPLLGLDAEEVLGIETAAKRLEAPGCAVAVAGPGLQAYVRARLLTAHYYRVIGTVPGADLVGDHFKTSYAISDVLRRRIFLFPAFLSPKRLLTRIFPDKRMEEKDSIPMFERTLGIKAGSVTEDTVQAIIIIHEHSHLNGTAPDDTDCTALSMINSRWVAEKCFPELIDGCARPDLMVVQAMRHRAKSCSGCHAAMNIAMKTLLVTRSPGDQHAAAHRGNAAGKKAQN